MRVYHFLTSSSQFIISGLSSQYITLLSIAVVIDFVCLFCGQIRKSGGGGGELCLQNGKSVNCLLFCFLNYYYCSLLALLCQVWKSVKPAQLKAEHHQPSRWAFQHGASCRYLTENRLGHKFTLCVC